MIKPPGNSRRRCIGIAAVALAATSTTMLSQTAASATIAPRAVGAAPLAASPPTDPAAPYTALVKSLIGAMTPQERITILRGATDPNTKGQAGYIAGIARLGIPDIRHTDALGINVYQNTTGVPNRLGTAAAFDRPLSNSEGVLEGTEGRAAGVDLLYGPQVDITRQPYWTRNFSTDGEDPYLSGELGSAEVNGVQSAGLLDQVKHFAFYNGQAQATPTTIDDQTAHEIYLQPYEKSLLNGGASSVMCSYQTYQISTEAGPQYACDNPTGENTILKGQFGFKGFVTTDYGATKETSQILGGTDNEMGTAKYYADSALLPLVDPTSATYSVAYATAVYQADARMLYQYERFGLLACASATGAVAGCALPARPTENEAAGVTEAEQLAEESAVLLKNTGATLPIAAGNLGNVAIIGPTANLLPSTAGGERSRGFGDREQITPLKALQSLAPAGSVLQYAPGVDRVGTVVPSTSLTAADGTTPGLTRTGSDGSTAVDPILAGAQTTGLAKGVNYTWTGSVNAATADTYQLWLETSIGSTVASNNSTNPLGSQGPVTVTIDGVVQSLGNPSSVIAPDYPGGQTLNGQYLGLNSTGTALALSAGQHTIKLTFNVSAAAATAPTIRFSWAKTSADVAAAVALAKTVTTPIVFVDDGGSATSGVGSAAGGVAPPAGGVESLPDAQNALISAVAAANPNTVVVLNTAQDALLPWASSVKSILEMWYPGQEGGTATARVLTGLVNPSGKLPITFPASNDATPLAGHPDRTTGVNNVVSFSEGLQVGYRWYDANNVTPAYAFGSGLSYTTFGYSALSYAQTADGGADVSFTITNTGTVAGTEVPQIYVGPAVGVPSTIQQVPKTLAQFTRVTLAPGAVSPVTLHIAKRQLSYWNTATQSWVENTNARPIYLAASSSDIRLTTTLPAAVTPALPEFSMALTGPIFGLFIGGGLLAYHRRRRTSATIG